MAQRIKDAGAVTSLDSQLQAPTPASDFAPAVRRNTGLSALGQFSAFFKAHYRPLVGFLKAKRWQSSEDAQDIAQDAFCRILDGLESGTTRLEPSHVYRIALSLATDRHRQRVGRRRLENKLLVYMEPTLNLEAHALSELQLRHLHNYLSELPYCHQRAFRRWYIDGVLQREIALELRVSTRMVTNYINQATCYCRLRLNGTSANKAWEWRNT